MSNAAPARPPQPARPLAACTSDEPRAALDRLATALGREFATTLVTGPGRRPRLNVTCRYTRAARDVYADDDGWYCWGWAERITPVDDPLAAAHRITAALRGHLPAGDQQ